MSLVKLELDQIYQGDCVEVLGKLPETVYKSSITRKSPNHKPHHRSIDESLAHLG